jgi:hypothetical protein
MWCVSGAPGPVVSRQALIEGRLLALHETVGIPRSHSEGFVLWTSECLEIHEEDERTGDGFILHLDGKSS